MKAGDLRHRVTFQSEGGEDNLDEYGQSIGWVDVYTVWASVEPLSGREFFAAQQVNSEVSVKIRMRYRSDAPTSDMRGFYNGKTYEVVAVIDVEERHDELHVLCKVVS